MFTLPKYKSWSTKLQRSKEWWWYITWCSVLSLCTPTKELASNATQKTTLISFMVQICWLTNSKCFLTEAALSPCARQSTKSTLCYKNIILLVLLGAGKLKSLTLCFKAISQSTRQQVIKIWWCIVINYGVPQLAQVTERQNKAARTQLTVISHAFSCHH